jgi:hypothetical protein
MATLKDLVEAKLDQIDWDEVQLEKGKVFAYSSGTEYNNFLGGVCWVAPGTGRAIIDIWGAGGSGAKMCCCGGGVPGNPGAWARKCICVVAGCIICGYVGRSCNNSNDLCFRGCSEATCLCWNGRNQYTGAATSGCMCAQGGRGGLTFCNPSGTLFCCFVGANYCNTNYSNGTCGIVCNYGSGTANCCAESYGGDINKRGGFSCATFWTCYSNCPCSTHLHVAIPPGLFACDGGVVSHGVEDSNGFANWSGMGYHQFTNALNGMSRSPARGVPFNTCWMSSRACGCYDVQGCQPFFPTGTGGTPAFPCGDVRDHAWRGGHGLIRITYIER